MFSYNGFFYAIPPWLYEYFTTRILMIMNRVTYRPGVEKKLTYNANMHMQVYDSVDVIKVQ